METKPVTIYRHGMFGVSKIEARSLEVTTEDYAQYKNASKVVFVEKGKRKAMGFHVTNRDYCLILEGHGHLDPPSWLTPVSKEGGFIVTKSKYASYDPRYLSDFKAEFAAYMAANPGATVLHKWEPEE